MINPTKYDYDNNGNLEKVTAANGAQTKMFYDLADILFTKHRQYLMNTFR